MIKRIVEPEILDSLPPDDPEAIRSRADLRFINKMMGGEAWILKEIGQLDGVRSVVELGAGEGALSGMIKEEYPDVQVIAVDLAGSSLTSSKGVEYLKADVLSSSYPVDSSTVVVANLFLHHLDAEALDQLAGRLRGAKALLFAEPYRSRLAIFWAMMLYPFVGRVTKYDMMVSIRAGFREGEIAASIQSDFQWLESVGVMGGIRSRAT